MLLVPNLCRMIVRSTFHREIQTNKPYEFRYLFLRLLRHFMPEGLARFLLKRRWIIKPGLEFTDPFSASARYVDTLSAQSVSIAGKRVLVFGYGGRFAVGVDLLKRGAAHVVLCDHFVLLDTERNLELLSAYGQYLKVEGDEVQPRGEFITLLHGDIREEVVQDRFRKWILSSVLRSLSIWMMCRGSRKHWRN